MNIRATLTSLGWTLIMAAAAVLLTALFYETGIRKALESAVPAGVLIALAGHLFTQSKAIADVDEKRSSFNLDGFTKAYDHAYSLLSDGNNDRATWIEAARCLAQGEELARAVTVAEHKQVLEIDRLKYRGLFYQCIANKQDVFFYGVPALYPTLDEAAIAASPNQHTGGAARSSRTKDLDEASLRMVWLASAWPKDYIEPKGGRFKDDELQSISMLFPDLHQFIQHRRSRSSTSKGRAT